MSLNKVILVGSVGQDPKPIGTSGKLVDISVATTSNQKNASGQWEKSTDWHNVRVVGSSAKFIQEYVTKGTIVAVDGQLKHDSWVGEDGQKKYRTYVLSFAVTIEHKTKEKSVQSNHNQAKSNGYQPQKENDIPEDLNDEIPF